MNDLFLNKKEETIFLLRKLMLSFGFLPFKMNKFEPLEFYLENKDFLASERILTFTDMNSGLLALKPDVTLSIAKNANPKKGEKQRFYYDENVYRQKTKDDGFCEIRQTGIECIGAVDTVDLFDVLTLAKRSLKAFSPDFIVAIGCVGIISPVLKLLDLEKKDYLLATKYYKEKNSHDLLALLLKNNVKEEYCELLLNLLKICGEPKSVLERLSKLKLPDESKSALESLKELFDLIFDLNEQENIVIDLSLTNDFGYYNGIVFEGYIKGASRAVISGGEYSLLMKKFHKNARAFGFAVYHDVLDEIFESEKRPDVDVILVYDENTDKRALLNQRNELLKNGKSVSLQCTRDAQMTAPQKEDLGGENNA